MPTFGTAISVTSAANGTISSGALAYGNYTVVIYNNGTAPVTLAGSAGGNGYLLYTNASVEFAISQNELLYAFVASGTADVRILASSRK